MLSIAFVACASPAVAGTHVSTKNCAYSHFYGYSSCVWTSTYVAPPFPDAAQERADAIAQAKQDEKWDSFCQPTFKTDQYGVRRASYAAKGCDVGRSE